MENEINEKQFAIAGIVLAVVFKVAMLPMMLANLSGRDAWISVAIIALLDAIQYFIVREVAYRGGFLSLVGKNKSVIIIIISIPVFIVMGIKCTVMLAEAVNYVSTFMFYNVDDSIIFVLFMMVAVFIATRGFGSIGKSLEILIWILPTIFIIGAIFGELKLKGEYLLPVFENGFSPVIKSSLRYIFWSCDFLPLAFVKLKRKNDKKSLLSTLGIVISVFTLVAFYVCFVANYGDSVGLIRNAFSTMASFNVATSEIGSLEWPTVTIWISSVSIYLATICCGVGNIGKAVGIQPRIFIVAFGTAIAVTSIFTCKDYQSVSDFASGNVKYFVVAVEILMPIIMLLLQIIGEKNANKEKSSRLQEATQ